MLMSPSLLPAHFKYLKNMVHTIQVDVVVCVDVYEEVFIAAHCKSKKNMAHVILGSLWYINHPKEISSSKVIMVHIIQGDCGGERHQRHRAEQA